MRSLISIFYFLILAVSSLTNATAQTNVDPITFENSYDQINLVYKAEQIDNRLDTFNIDVNRTVTYLKEGIIRHYHLKVPSEWTERIEDGGYNIKSVIRSNHRELYNENEAISTSGIDTLDIIEVKFQMYSRSTMECPPSDVFVQVNNFNVDNKNAEARLTIGGEVASVKTIVHEGLYQFYFDSISYCNPLSWVAELEVNGKIYYLANPKVNDFSNSLNIEPSLYLEFTMKD